jgi:diaminopimelate decarboxylase
MYEAYHALYNLSHPDGLLTRYDVVGNICESGDVFARDRWLQQVREGDVLAVLDVGAYGMSMASTYNLRPLPAEVMVEADGTTRLVTRRQSVAELVDRLMG